MSGNYFLSISFVKFSVLYLLQCPFFLGFVLFLIFCYSVFNSVLDTTVSPIEYWFLDIQVISACPGLIKHSILSPPQFLQAFSHRLLLNEKKTINH